MHLLKSILLLIGAVAGSSVLTGCIYDSEGDCEGLYYSQLFVDYDWKDSPGASPEGMACYFFPINGGDAWRFDLPGSEGGEVKLPTGKYGFVTFNDDSSDILIAPDDDYLTISATTFPASLFDGASGGSVDISSLPQLADVEDQKVMSCPDMMWSYATPRVDVKLESRPQVIPATPRQIVRQYHFDITDVENLDGAARICCAISGMTPSVSLSDMALSDVQVILPLRAYRQGGDAIHGDFLTFGPSAASGNVNYLFLFVWLTDGRRCIFRFDVTTQVVNAPDPMDVWLRVGGLTLPESDPAQGGAFDVTVDGWTTIIINLTD